VHAGFWWGNLKEKTPLGRSGHRWEDSIKMGVKEIGSENMNWNHLAQDRDR
jgi:hypothetical protein